MQNQSAIGYVMIAFMIGNFALVFTASHWQPNANIFLQPAADQAGTSSQINKSSRDSSKSKTSNKITKAPEQIQVDIPDFASFTNVKEKKRAFFDYFRPITEEENKKLRQQRAIVTQINQDFSKNKQLNKNQYQQLAELTQAFGIDSDKPLPIQIDHLLNRVNVIPESLVLAQAANESGWGTSRFALKAYNFFGEWCFTKGCGLIPSGRTGDSKHEVQKFRTPSDSVASYFRNLNTHWAYKDLRAIRREQAENNEVISGYLLAGGLGSYSQRGEHYIDELRAMIRVNRLEDIHIIQQHEVAIAEEKQAREAEKLAKEAEEAALLAESDYMETSATGDNLSVEGIQEFEASLQTDSDN